MKKAKRSITTTICVIVALGVFYLIACACIGNKKFFPNTSINGIDVVDSRQVAEAVGKEHYNLLKDIRVYCNYLNEVKIDLVDFFIESTYTDTKGEQRPCYLDRQM